jgi:hypothetical protein
MRTRYVVPLGLWLTVACAGSSNGIIGIASGGTAATHLAFTVQPSTAATGAVIAPAVVVVAQNSSGNADTSFANSVTVALGANPAAGTLAGTTTVSASRGVATFNTLSINKASSGYTLTATATLLTGATSTSFSITP